MTNADRLLRLAEQAMRPYLHQFTAEHNLPALQAVTLAAFTETLKRASPDKSKELLDLVATQTGIPLCALEAYYKGQTALFAELISPAKGKSGGPRRG